MKRIRLAAPFALRGFCVLFLLTSCGAIRQEWQRGIAARKEKARIEALRTAAAAPHPKPPVWNPEAGDGPPKIVINLTEQRAYFYKGETVVGESNISSGKKGFETPPGRYRVIQKDANHVSSLYGQYVNAAGEVVQRDVDTSRNPQPPETIFRGVPMPYFLRFTGGYGMHAGFVPRFRASHGCVRMPTEMAQHFFEAAEIGTPVMVEE
ncbi:MAG: L,D-transpeptidase family protein [Chthoniobacterales bacterium]